VYFDESAWVALGFVLFIALVWRKVGTALASLLDSRAQKIKEELSEAENLRAEAEAELRRLKILQNEAEEDAKLIVADARAAADRIRAAAVEKAEVAIKRREAQATTKIAAAEASVITDLRVKATSIAIAASKEVLATELNTELGASMIDNSLAEIAAATKS
jgi:F-type H+-transporting ATPase subunit b